MAEKEEKKDVENQYSAEPLLLIATANASAHKDEQAQDREQPQQHQQHEQAQQPQQKNWEQYVPKAYRKMVEKEEKKDVENRNNAEPLLLVATANASVER